MSDDEKKMKHSKPMEKNPNWKGGSSFKYCECGEKISIVNKTCIKCRDTSYDKNPFFNKTHTEESRKLISDNHATVTWIGGKTNGSFKKGNLHPKSKQIKVDGIIYDSIRIASEILNINRPKLKKIGGTEPPKIKLPKLKKVSSEATV